jgi:osmotically-inducible protein OsmY
MKGKVGLFLAGSVAVLLLEPSGGARRRARVKGWLGPVQQQIGRLRGRASRQDEAPDGQQPTILSSVQHVAEALQAPFQTPNGATGQQSANAEAGQATTGSTQDAAHAAPIAEQMAPALGIDPIPEGETNDPTLVARVESEVFRDAAIPKGQLNVDAANGVVTLRGTVKDDAAAQDLVERTGAVEGVDKVVDLLHRG